MTRVTRPAPDPRAAPRARRGRDGTSARLAAPIALALIGCSAGRAAPEPPPAPSASAATPTATGTRKVTLDGLIPTHFAPGHAPSAAHPRGTLVTLAFADGAPFVVEVDLADLHEVKRTAIPTASPDIGGARIARDGDTLHVAISTEGLVTLTALRPDLAIARQVALRARFETDPTPLFGFAVVDGHAIVVDDYRIIAHVFDAAGKELAAHACNGQLPHPGQALLETAGETVVLANLISEDDGRPVCAFRADGTGSAVQAKIGKHEQAFAHAGALYARDAAAGIADSTHRLDAALRPTGPAIPDPRPARRFDAWCPTLKEPMVAQADVLWGIPVAYAVRCCGSPGPIGLHVCSAVP